MKPERYYILYKWSPYHKSVWLESELSKVELDSLKKQFGKDLILVEKVAPATQYERRQQREKIHG